VKAGNVGEVARLMDEGEEAAWLGWAPVVLRAEDGGGGGGGGGVWRARRMRWPLFDLPCEAAQEVILGNLRISVLQLHHAFRGIQFRQRPIHNVVNHTHN